MKLIGFNKKIAFLKIKLTKYGEVYSNYTEFRILYQNSGTDEFIIYDLDSCRIHTAPLNINELALSNNDKEFSGSGIELSN